MDRWRPFHTDVNLAVLNFRGICLNVPIVFGQTCSRAHIIAPAVHKALNNVAFKFAGRQIGFGMAARCIQTIQLTVHVEHSVGPRQQTYRAGLAGPQLMLGTDSKPLQRTQLSSR